MLISSWSWVFLCFLEVAGLHYSYINYLNVINWGTMWGANLITPLCNIILHRTRTGPLTVNLAHHHEWNDYVLLLLLSNDDDLVDPVSLIFHLITSSLILHILAVTTSTRSMAMSLPTMNFRDVKRREMGIRGSMRPSKVRFCKQRQYMESELTCG